MALAAVLLVTMPLVTMPLVTMPLGNGPATPGCRYHALSYHALSYRALWEADQQPWGAGAMPMANAQCCGLSCSYSNLAYRVPTVM